MKFRGPLLGITVLLAAACAAPAAAQRLPTTVTPEHYDLAFDVDLAGARFRGTESIRVQLSEPSRRIVLHALDMQIEEATVEAGGSTQRATVAMDAPTETAALVLPREVPRGAATLHFKFAAGLNKDLRGFYLSRANGRNYAVTQFESTDARRAFPSFDEPAYKATFSLAATIDGKDTAISNGRVLSDTPGPGVGRHTLKFAETPKMSSYLVAMAIGDFECLEGGAEGVPIRICATPDKKQLGRIALGAAEKILAFYNRYYSIKYPFGKLDSVAVPDFAAGAMENTAAIFYREADLLADEKTASVANQIRIWSVLAHEMAHQWFGDLVTMRWWDDLWLNEGFATWMEKQPLIALKPEWHIEVDAAQDTQQAMSVDVLASTHAIHSTVETPAQIEESFDTIVYEKGAAVMRMVEGFVGSDAFRTGVNAYLEKHQYSNATSQDFWTTVSAASGRPVDRILPSFVNQPGVPLITYRQTCDGGRPVVSMTQQRFLVGAASSSSTAASSTGQWMIPVCPKMPNGGSIACSVFDSSGAGAASAVSRGANGSPSGPTSSCSAWTLLNADGRGYFRTEYAPEMLAALAPDVETKLTAPERLSVIGDEWALVRAGRHTVADFLTLAAGYSGERVAGVLSQLTEALTLIHDRLTTDQTRAPFEHFVQMLLRPALNDVGLSPQPGESDDRRALRQALIEALADDPQVGAEARQLLDGSLSGKRELDPTAASAIASVAARHGDAALYDALLKAARAAKSPDERYRYLYALADFRNPALTDRALLFALTPELRSQDTAIFLGRLLEDPTTIQRAWTFTKQHWSEIEPKIKVSGGETRVVQALDAFCDARSRDDVRTFFSNHKLAAVSRTLDQTLEHINNCIAMRDKQAPVLADWLARTGKL